MDTRVYDARTTALQIIDAVANYGAKPDGETDNTAVFERIKTDVGSDNVVVFLRRGIYVVNPLLTFPANVEFVGNGASFSGISVRIANLSFRGDMVKVTDFGAVGGGVVDDTTAIQNAATFAGVAGLGLKFPKRGTYKTTDTITIPANVPVQMDDYIVYSTDDNKPGLVVGATATVNFNVEMVLAVRRATVSDWTNEGSIGIKLFNANTCKVHIRRAEGFTIGVQFMGSAAGFAYNEVSLGYLLNNKYGVDCTNELVGWCNENQYFGGRFTNNTGVRVGITRYGVRIRSSDGTYLNNNNNVFTKPSFELNQTAATPGEAIPVLITGGQNNRFVACRRDGNHATIFARITGGGGENRFDTGYADIDYTNIDDQSLYPTSYVTGARTALHFSIAHTIFDSGDLRRKWCYYDAAATKIHLQGVDWYNGPGVGVAAELATFSNNAITPGASRICGVWVDTSIVKRFIVRKRANANRGGRSVIIPYDVNGVRLTSAGAGHPYVKGSVQSPPAYSANFGGCYQQGSDTTSDWFVHVGADVAYMFVAFAGGTNPLELLGFSIVALDFGEAVVYIQHEPVNRGANIALAAPTAGTWAVGKVVYNAAPASGQPIGWVCTAAGTPGTWKAFGTIA